MAEAYRPDGQLNIPTQAAADEMNTPEGRAAFEQAMAQGRARVDAIADKNKNKELKMLLSKATGIEQGPKSLTATRDIVSDFLLNNIYGDDYTKQNVKTVGNFMGGAGQGFLDMGVSDVTVIPGLMDSYDAFNRLQKAKKNDDFTDAEQRSIEASPITLLPLKLAAIAAGAMGNDNAISDYYDGKKGDIVTMYAGPAGLIGISAGVVSLLKKFGRSAIDAPVFGGFLKKSSPKLGTLPE
tara:strand:- start:41 stop:757 length:717 start_codon:yes stop_codon:yes gene_type:complete